MGFWRKRTASPVVVCVLLVSTFVLSGSTLALGPAQEPATETVEVHLWSPSSWMAWLVDWMTGGVQTNQEAASTEPCPEAECSPTGSEPTGSGEEEGSGSGGGGINPTTEGGPTLDVNG